MDHCYLDELHELHRRTEKLQVQLEDQFLSEAKVEELGDKIDDLDEQVYDWLEKHGMLTELDKQYLRDLHEL